MEKSGAKAPRSRILKAPEVFESSGFCVFFRWEENPFPEIRFMRILRVSQKTDRVKLKCLDIFVTFSEGLRCEFRLRGMALSRGNPTGQRFGYQMMTTDFPEGRKSCLTITILGADSHIDT